MRAYLNCFNYLLISVLVLTLIGCANTQKPAKVASAKPNIKRVPPKRAGDKPQIQTRFSKNNLSTKEKNTRDRTIALAESKRNLKEHNSEDRASEKPPLSDSNSKLAWCWPAQGTILKRFTVTNSSFKGIDIGGSEGTPILAASEGEVVYSGNSLRGYGNLIIIKHKKNFITAYAHNRINIVKEGEAVKIGQRIAEMGQTGTDRVKLHFEVRYHGKPVDPQSILPSR